MRTRVAVIENEFGEVGIDDELLAKNTKVQAEEELIEMMNGCICCTVRQDLVVVLQKVHARAMHASARACECTRVRCMRVHVCASAHACDASKSTLHAMHASAHICDACACTSARACKYTRMRCKRVPVRASARACDACARELLSLRTS